MNRLTDEMPTHGGDSVDGGDAPATPAVLEIFGQKCEAAARFTRHQCGVMLEGLTMDPFAGWRIRAVLQT